MSHCPYEILGVSKYDNLEKITQKYRKLALKYHPDKNKNKKEYEEKFKTITKAYNEIINKTPKNFDTFNDNLHLIKKFMANLKNIEVSSLVNNLIKEISVISDFYNKKNNIEKTDNLYINATIDIFDIYNSIEKKIIIERIRKCANCLGIGLTINNDNIFNICKICHGKKLCNKKITLDFNCKNRIHIFHGLSNHSFYKNPGDVIIFIHPKFCVNTKLTEIELENYEIINSFDLLYNYCLPDFVNSIEKLLEKNKIEISFLHLDNKVYNLIITNPLIHYRYKIYNLGLLYDNEINKRGDLYITLNFNNNIHNSKIYIK